MNDDERLELFNADELVPVEACRVYLTNVGGQWHWSAQAADWVSLMTDREVGGILHTASRALAALADHFGPPPDKDDPPPVLKLVKDDTAPPDAG